MKSKDFFFQSQIYNKYVFKFHIDPRPVVSRRWQYTPTLEISANWIRIQNIKCVTVLCLYFVVNPHLGYAGRKGKLCDGMVTILADANINRPDIHITHQFVQAFGIIGCNEPCNHCYSPQTGPPLYTRFQQPGKMSICNKKSRG